jgi:hypothetical protein
MTTGIRGLSNESDVGVSFINQENLTDSRYIPAKSSLEVYAWISQHSDKPLIIQTKKGVLAIWDSNYQILGSWNGEETIILYDNTRNTQDYYTTVIETGDVQLKPRS